MRLLTAAVVFALFAGFTLLLLRPRDARVAPVGPYEPLVTTPECDCQTSVTSPQPLYSNFT